MSFNKPTLGEITACCLDDRQRKVIVGSATGEIMILNYLNGAFMKSTVNNHEKSVVSLIYNDEDKCLISTSWDRSIRIYDEEPPEDLEAMRIINNCHIRDISCTAFSRRLSIVATGSPGK